MDNDIVVKEILGGVGESRQGSLKHSKPAEVEKGISKLPKPPATGEAQLRQRI